MFVGCALYALAVEAVWLTARTGQLVTRVFVLRTIAPFNQAAGAIHVGPFADRNTEAVGFTDSTVLTATTGAFGCAFFVACFTYAAFSRATLAIQRATLAYGNGLKAFAFFSNADLSFGAPINHTANALVKAGHTGRTCAIYTAEPTAGAF